MAMGTVTRKGRKVTAYLGYSHGFLTKNRLTRRPVKAPVFPGQYDLTGLKEKELCQRKNP
jgi:hypothetical protein